MIAFNATHHRQLFSKSNRPRSQAKCAGGDFFHCMCIQNKYRKICYAKHFSSLLLLRIASEPLIRTNRHVTDKNLSQHIATGFPEFILLCPVGLQGRASPSPVQKLRTHSLGTDTSGTIIPADTQINAAAWTHRSLCKPKPA